MSEISHPVGAPLRQNPSKGSGIAWCWQDKRAREAIRNHYQDSSLLSVALGVNDGLTEIASDEGSNEFDTTLAWIALKSGTSIASVKRVLPGLEAIPLVEVIRPKLKGPARYRLLAIAQAAPTIAQAAPTIAQGRNTSSRASYKEQGKELKQNETPREAWKIEADIKRCQELLKQTKLDGRKSYKDQYGQPHFKSELTEEAKEKVSLLNNRLNTLNSELMTATV